MRSAMATGSDITWVMVTDEDDVLAQAEAVGYEFVEGRYRGQPAWKWQGSWPNPFFLDRGEALRWMAGNLRQRQLT